MAIKSQIDIDVNSGDLKSISALFGKYKQEAKQTAMLMGRVEQALKTSKKISVDLSNGINIHLGELEKLSIWHKTFNSAGQLTSNTFKNLSSSTRAVADNLARSALSLFNIIALTGTIAGLVGLGGGLFGLDQMAYGVTNRRRSNLGLGVNYGAANAFGVNFGRFGDANAMLGNVSTGLYDYTNPAYTAFLASGLDQSKLQNNDAAQVSLDILKKLPEMFAGTPEGMIGSKAEALGLTQIMSVKEIVAYLHASPEERRSQIANYEKDKRTLNLSKESQLKWANFSTTLTRAGIKIETIFADKLTPLAIPLTKLSQNMLKVIDAFSKSPVIGNWLEKAATGVENFGKYIGSPEFKNDMNSFLGGIEAMMPVVKKILEIAGLVLKSGYYAGKLLFDPNYNPTTQGFLGDVLGRGNPARAIVTNRGRGPSIRYHGINHSHNFSNDRLGTGLVPMTDNGMPQTGLQAVAGETTDQLAARIQQIYPSFTSDECVELAKKTAGISGSVREWERGNNALLSRPPIGTPVATFMDRSGLPSNYYDGHQGVGAPGNNTTHAGIVAGYTKDGNLILAEQWRGSNGVHFTEYANGDQRGGEKDASNYFVINKNGLPAGTNDPYRAQFEQNGDDVANHALGANGAGIEDRASRARPSDLMGRKTSMLDHYHGLRNPSSVLVHDRTQNGAIIVSSDLAFG